MGRWYEVDERQHKATMRPSPMPAPGRQDQCSGSAVTHRGVGVGARSPAQQQLHSSDMSIAGSTVDRPTRDPANQAENDKTLW